MTAQALFEQHHLAVFRYLKRMAGSAEDAEEATQDVFVRVTRALPGSAIEGHEVAWLFEIARNVALNRRRDRGRRPAPDSLEVEAAMITSGGDVASKLDLSAALASLPVPDRDAFLLREVGGLGYAEIARVTRATEDAVRNRIHRARVALREFLEPSLQAARRPRSQER